MKATLGDRTEGRPADSAPEQAGEPVPAVGGHDGDQARRQHQPGSSLHDRHVDPAGHLADPPPAQAIAPLANPADHQTDPAAGSRQWHVQPSRVGTGRHRDHRFVGDDQFLEREAGGNRDRGSLAALVLDFETRLPGQRSRLVTPANGRLPPGPGPGRGSGRRRQDAGCRPGSDQRPRCAVGHFDRARRGIDVRRQLRQQPILDFRPLPRVAPDGDRAPGALGRLHPRQRHGHGGFQPDGPGRAKRHRGCGRRSQFDEP